LSGTCQIFATNTPPPSTGTPATATPTATPTPTPSPTPTPVPSLENVVIPFNPNAYSQTSVANCPQNDYHCLVHVSVRSLIQNQLQPASRNLTHGTILEIIVYNEYLTSIPNGPTFDWSNEAVARRLYQACGLDGCVINHELYDFLEYYQSALNDRLEEDYALIQEHRSRTNRPDITANLERLANTVSLISNSPPASWLGGTGGTLPYGFGTAYCVKTDANTLNQYLSCGAATTVILDTSTNPESPNGAIFFGTTLNNDGVGICKLRLCP
jgi:hypothetical protein